MDILVKGCQPLEFAKIAKISLAKDSICDVYLKFIEADTQKDISTCALCMKSPLPIHSSIVTSGWKGFPFKCQKYSKYTICNKLNNEKGNIQIGNRCSFCINTMFLFENFGTVVQK